MTSSIDLHKMTTAELGQLFPIIIQEYSDAWPTIYEKEKKLLLNALDKTDIVSIDHIGSTAIPGIRAKPTIDILLQVSEQVDIKKLAKVFQLHNYNLTKQPNNPPPHLSFFKGYTIYGFRGQAFHVHIRYKSDWDEVRFRDYLRNDKETAEEYEFLKLELAARYKNDREAYTHAKTEFISKINALTRQG